MNLVRSKIIDEAYAGSEEPFIIPSFPNMGVNP